MDELTELRHMRAEVSRPGPDRLTTGRERLQAAIDNETSAHRTASDRQPAGGVMDEIKITRASADDGRGLLRRRPVVAVAAAVAAAVAVTATAVVADDVADGPGGSSPSVSDVAREKDDREADARGQKVSPETAKKVLRRAADKVRNGPEAETPRDDQFVYTRTVSKETDRRTGKSRTTENETWKSVDLSKPSWEGIPGESGWSDPSDETEGNWPHYDWTVLEKLPTDPEKLILAVRKPMGPPTKATSLKQVRKPEWQDIWFQLQGYATAVPLIPKDLRAAALDALTLVPGIKAEHMKDAQGHTRLAISSKNTLFPDAKALFDEENDEYAGSTGVRKPGKKTYDDLSYLADYAIVDKAKQRP